ncbi:hypothetical protein ACJQWY_02305 [Weissella kandleri]|uniref:hypothetical protein n=1 Tax=Weissella kandleri TaxID=1616 RepID=UPI00387EE73A
MTFSKQTIWNTSTNAKDIKTGNKDDLKRITNQIYGVLTFEIPEVVSENYAFPLSLEATFGFVQDFHDGNPFLLEIYSVVVEREHTCVEMDVTIELVETGDGVTQLIINREIG